MILEIRPFSANVSKPKKIYDSNTSIVSEKVNDSLLASKNMKYKCYENSSRVEMNVKNKRIKRNFEQNQRQTAQIEKGSYQVQLVNSVQSLKVKSIPTQPKLKNNNDSYAPVILASPKSTISSKANLTFSKLAKTPSKTDQKLDLDVIPVKLIKQRPKSKYINRNSNNDLLEKGMYSKKSIAKKSFRNYDMSWREKHPVQSKLEKWNSSHSPSQLGLGDGLNNDLDI